MTATIGKCTLVASVLLALTGGDVGATSIVCIRSPEAVVIAADSMLTVRSGDKERAAATECKIRQSGTNFFALSGLYKDPARGFDVIDSIRDALRDRHSLREGADAIAAKIANDLLVELARLKTESPEDYTFIKRRGRDLTSILLTGFEQGMAEAILLKFKPVVSEAGEMTLETERTACPGDCNPRNTQAFYLTDMKGINDYLGRGNKIDWQAPDKAAKLLVGLTIDAHTPGVAPPIDVLRIDANGPRWIAHKPECPEIDGSAATE